LLILCFKGTVNRISGTDFTDLQKDIKDTHPKSINHLLNLSEQEEFFSVMGSYLDWYK